MIRDARPEDAAAIGAIWNPVIRDTAITFWPTERTEAEIRAYIAAKQDPGHGCFVLEQGGTIAGAKEEAAPAAAAQPAAATDSAAPAEAAPAPAAAPTA